MFKLLFMSRISKSCLNQLAIKYSPKNYDPRKLASPANKYKIFNVTKSSSCRVSYLLGAFLAAPLLSNDDKNIYNLNQKFKILGPPPNIEISWSELCYQLVAKGEVDRIAVDSDRNLARIMLRPDAMIDGIKPPTLVYFMKVNNVDAFEMKLREFESSIGIRVDEQIPIMYFRSTIAGSITTAVIILGCLYFFRKPLKSMFKTTNVFGGMTKAKFTLFDPTNKADSKSIVKFTDVAGLKEAKVEVMEFVDYLKNSNKYLQLGAKLPKGVLLLGPPGCGKTLLAKALASECNVPFLALAGSDFVEMIGGVGASRVRSLFKQANKLAPCIIYIDEIDSIGQQRRDSTAGRNGESERTLNQLLVEMDGMTSRKNVLLLASTNRAEVLDNALLRPGRFDRHIMIDLPNLEERKELFMLHASKIKLSHPPSEMAARIASLTPGMSGADIANICNEAALHAARKNQMLVYSNDLEYAIERVVGGTEKRSSSISQDERKIIAYHESGHALVGWLLQYADPILKVSIVPRTTSVLGFAQYLPSDRKLYSPEQLFDVMCMALGGRCAELLIFNHLSTGAQNDLSKVTEMAMAQIKQYGFDSEVGNLHFPPQEKGDMGSSKPYSKKLASVIDRRASLLVKRAFDATYNLLSANVDKLELLATNLIDKEVLNSQDIEALIGPRPHTGETKNKRSVGVGAA